MPLEHLRLSQTAKDQLIKLKRVTGIKNWNVLCRWGLCASLAESSAPPDAKIPADSSVEMTWRVFGGPDAELYWALVRLRCEKDGISPDDDSVAHQFRLHLHRGIGYLAGNRKLTSVEALVGMAVETGAADTSKRRRRKR